MAAKIHVIVPVFNRKLQTERFLRCLRAQTFRNFKIVIVDDGSMDGTGEMVTGKFPEAKLLRADGNLWWTGAINLGIRHTLTQASAVDAILVINDDVEIYPNYLDTLYRLWQSMPRTLIGSVLVDIDSPELIYDGGTIVNWWTAKFTVLNRGERVDRFRKEHYVEASFLTGRGTLIPIPVFQELGLYDDKHFQQCGDTELPVRAKHSGYRLIVSYGAIVKTAVAASNDVNLSNELFLKDIAPYFLGVKSNCRLRYRFFFCIKTAVNPFQLISFLTLDLVRITAHFVLRLKFKPASIRST